METFPSLGLSADFGPQLDELGITTPTPIQAAAIPILLEGKDLIGIAQTGTGKTLAFGLPIIESLRQKGGRALIMAPTRELAVQIAQSLRAFTGPLRLKSAVLVGGVGMQGQCADLRRRPDIVVATPGRLLDHVMKGNVRLREFDKVVLDEADRMLDMGFLPAIEQILHGLAQPRQSMMFSATLPDSIEMMVSRHLNSPERVEITPPGTTVHLIEQEAYMVHQEEKNDLLSKLIESGSGPVLVFARTRHGARKVAHSMVRMGHDAAEIHSDRTQAQRDAAMNGFRSGRYRVLVATDIAARGIDVKDIELVVQYDLPDNPEDYVHRIGRTGRAGATGRAVTFVTPEKTRKLEELEQIVGLAIPTAADSPLERPEPRRRHTRVKPLSARKPDYSPPVARVKPAMQLTKRNDEWAVDRVERPRRPEHPFAARPETHKPERPVAYERPPLAARKFNDRPSAPRPDSRNNERPYERPAERSYERPAERSYDRPAARSYDRPYEPRQDTRPQPSRPYEGRSYDRRPADNRPHDSRPHEPRPADRRPYDGRPSRPVERDTRPSRPYNSDSRPSERYERPQRDINPIPKAPKRDDKPRHEAARPAGRPKPNATPNAFKPKFGKSPKGKKGVPGGGFKVPKRKR